MTVNTQDIENLPYTWSAPRNLPPYGIGIVGAGNIVKNVHLPAYRKAGFNVVCIFDLDSGKAAALAAEFGIKQVAGSLEELLNCPEVEVVDVAFPGQGRLAAVRQIAAAGKAMLLQKPLADTLTEAVEIVKAAEAAGVLLAVNQNARWAPQYRCAGEALKAGFLGELFYAAHLLWSNHDQMTHHARWLIESQRYQLIQYGVHHFDVMRMWFGRLPEAVTAHISRRPGQRFVGDMMATVIFDFGKEAMGTLLETNALPLNHPYSSQFVLAGTLASASLQSEVLTFRSEESNQAFTPALKGFWFPDAFSATMGELLVAMNSKTQPSINGHDNLLTLAMVEAAYRSAEQGRRVTLAEIKNDFSII